MRFHALLTAADEKCASSGDQELGLPENTNASFTPA